MGFWIFMLCMSLLMPFIMIGFGSYFIKKAPKEINYLVGYRTVRSMQNRDTWEFAHHYCGRLWRNLGWPTLIISVIVMLLTLGKGEDAVGIAGAVLVSAQLIPIIVSVVLTEKALKKRFDECGNRKEQA